MALLALLHRLAASWRLTLTVAHFNYGLRGTESDGDEVFVVSLCRKLGVPLHVRKLSVGRRGRGNSFQAEARRLRYEALETIARECGADRITVGHTADDQAETVLLWMLRGAGLAGLSGMPPSREGGIVRPLYDVSRAEVLAYLRVEGVQYREDSSNAKPRYLRNRIRHEVLPVLRHIVPASVLALCRLADLCREDERYLDGVIADLVATHVRQERDGSWSFSRTLLRDLPHPLQRRVVRAVLRGCDPHHRSPGAEAVDRVVRCGLTDKALTADLKMARLVATREQIRLIPGRQAVRARASLQPKVLTVPSAVVWAGTGQRIQAQHVAHGAGQDASRNGRQAILLDADRISGPLTVRAWEPGDRFCPLGMNGRSKKLQDFFTDLKVPVETRTTIPVLAAPEGIVWVIGYRQDERFAVHGTTQHRVLVSVEHQPELEGVR